MEYPKLQPKDDARYKILPEDHPKIIKKYRELGYYRPTARFFGVDRKTIKNIVHPDFKKSTQEKRYKKKPWLEEYQKAKEKGTWNKTMSIHRKKKRKIHGPLMTRYEHYKGYK